MAERLQDSSECLLNEVDAALALVRSEAAAALAASYKRGFEEGFRAAQTVLNETLQNALGARLGVLPAPVHKDTRHSIIPERQPAPASRAARGSIRAFIVSSLKAEPNGLTEQDLSKKVELLNPDISPRSMGGELRRMRGRLYDVRGGKWFLLSGFFTDRIAAESSEDSAAPATQATEEETDAPATTTIAA